MNNLGVLGLGSVSTVYYIELLNRTFHLKNEGYSTCPFTMININFNDINPYLPNDFVNIKRHILPFLEYIDSLKIKNLIIPNITIHESIDSILLEENFKFNLIHPVNILINYLIQEDIKEIILLGTKYTMSGAYIKTKLQGHGISIIKLDSETISLIDSIRKEVYHGNIEKGKDQLNEISKKYPNRKIVLACTELSVAAKENLFYIDMVSLHVKKTIEII